MVILLRLLHSVSAVSLAWVLVKLGFRAKAIVLAKTSFNYNGPANRIIIA